AVLAEHVGVLEHVDPPERGAPKRSVDACRSGNLREVAEQEAARGRLPRLTHAGSRLMGTSRPCSRAAATASSYPASTWRSTPVPGSVVSTRSRRSAASSVPSATTTMPAWIELPIPTPPPWCTLTHVAPAATFSSHVKLRPSAAAAA